MLDGIRETGPLAGQNLALLRQRAEGFEVWLTDGTGAGTRKLTASARLPRFLGATPWSIFYQVTAVDSSVELFAASREAAPRSLRTVAVGGFLPYR